MSRRCKALIRPKGTWNEGREKSALCPNLMAVFPPAPDWEPLIAETGRISRSFRLTGESLHLIPFARV